MSFIETLLLLPSPLLHHWGYWVILIAAMLESTPVFGLLIPGQVIVILGGFFAKTGILDLGDVLWVSALGAIVGDGIGYFLGRKYGHSFITRYGRYFFFRDKQYHATQKLMRQHSGKTLVLGRFASLTRAFAPFVAGSTRVPFLTFLVYNIIGGVSWAVSFVLLGYVFGASYEVTSKYIGRFVVIAIILSILFMYAYRFINKRKRIFEKYHIYALMLNVFSLYIFSKMLEDVLDHEFITKIDWWLSQNVVMLWNPWLNKIMLVITQIVSPLNLFILSLILFIFLLFKKKWYNSLLLICSLIGGLLLEVLVKLIIHRARPENAYITVGGYSFPSGHATMSVIFFSLLLYSFKDDIKRGIARNTFILTNIILFVLIGFSRVYLNVHWLSDVIAGFAIGLFPSIEPGVYLSMNGGIFTPDEIEKNKELFRFE